MSRSLDDRLTAQRLALLAAQEKAFGGFASFRSNVPSFRAPFDPAEHPRDERGRFIDKPGVRLPDGRFGVAVGTRDGKTVVALADGTLVQGTVADATPRNPHEASVLADPVPIPLGTAKSQAALVASLVTPTAVPGMTPEEEARELARLRRNAASRARRAFAKAGKLAALDLARKKAFDAEKAVKAEAEAAARRKRAGTSPGDRTGLPDGVAAALNAYDKIRAARPPARIADTNSLRLAKLTEQVDDIRVRLAALRERTAARLAGIQNPDTMEPLFATPADVTAAVEMEPDVFNMSRNLLLAERTADELRERLRETGQPELTALDLQSIEKQSEASLKALFATGRRAGNIDLSLMRPGFAYTDGPTDHVLAETQALVDVGAAIEEEAMRRVDALGLEDPDEIARLHTLKHREWEAMANTRKDTYLAEQGFPPSAELRAILDDPWSYPPGFDHMAARQALRNSSSQTTASPEEEALLQEMANLLPRVQGLRNARVKAATEARVAVLAEIRPLGESKPLNYRLDDRSEKDPEEVAAMFRDVVRSVYPKDWNDKIDESLTSPMLLKSSGRGYWNEGLKTMALTSVRVDDTRARATAIHEYGHVSEYQLPDLKMMEWAYHWQRTGTVQTKGAAKGAMKRVGPENRVKRMPGYAAKEKGAQDTFTDVYTGKVYVDSPDSAWEIFQTGVQSVLADNRFTAEDPGLTGFTLGALAVL